MRAEGIGMLPWMCISRMPAPGRHPCRRATAKQSAFEPCQEAFRCPLSRYGRYPTPRLCAATFSQGRRSWHLPAGPRRLRRVVGGRERHGTLGRWNDRSSGLPWVMCGGKPMPRIRLRTETQDGYLLDLGGRYQQSASVNPVVAPCFFGQDTAPYSPRANPVLRGRRPAVVR